MVGLKDVAREAGVSARTVSRVMRGEQNVAPETRERIRRIANDLGYRPNLAARGLRSRRTHEIVLVAWEQSIFNDAAELFVQRIEGLEHRLLEDGLPLKVRIVKPPEDRLLPESLIDDLVTQQPVGVAMFGSRQPMIEGMIEHLEDAGIPTVVIGQSMEEGGAEMVNISVDRASGIRESVDHLVKQGRRRIMYVGYDTPSRMQGYLSAMTAHGLEPLTRFVNPQSSSPSLFECGRQTAGEIAALAQRPEAVQAYSDVLALGLLDGFKAAGLRLPDDIALVGFDDRTSARMCHPALTTIALPNRQLGTAAGEVLVARHRGQSPRDGTWSRRIPTRLVVRQTA